MPARPKAKILFVDDEPTIRLTMPVILERQGFRVRTAGTVAEALSLIQEEHFDVLLSDLNIGQPGDGFTVVSAMRRLQPHVVTLILTGYPGFETALAAIRNQVDDYLVKPTEAEQLVALIREKLENRRPHQQITPRRVAEFVRDSADRVLQAWLREVNGRPEFRAARLSDHDRLGELPELLSSIVQRLVEGESEPTAEWLETAARHGTQRRREGYDPGMLIEEFRLLREQLTTLIHQNLLGLEVSFLLPDMRQLNSCLDLQMKTAVCALLGEASLPQKSPLSKSPRSTEPAQPDRAPRNRA